MQIKPLQQTNKNQWQTLWQGYLDFYQTHLPQATTDNTWQKIVDENSSIYGFGAWQNDDQNEKLVGFVHVVLHPNTWNTNDCCYLEDLFVNDKARGQGIGEALIKYVYDFAKTKNCNRVYWVTDSDNITAQRLYEKVANKMDFIQYRHNF